ncbi:serine hydrolase domain-containing protein [Sporosarcina limicola]|uniref:CubicO group peptidase (Beta-lactamase class C family) n=1 Tax=Sporosarcina limicola TaxID=34101 RepID=A0A927R4Q4_9BACL|nr:serine hydrolase domain-containing protein [Sporosarcina limicola]MBE1556471.1 CubicO group peptidase (beta-lactamase class C family) [Sporosarcina limicola]
MIVEERISYWVESYDQNGYLNGSILIASNDKILLNKGFGMANWEYNIPNMPTTKFRIGSLTKAFTAMGIFQLHEKQKLNINDHVGKYLPDYPNGDRITIYHCLTNSSGIPNYTNFADFWSSTMRLPSTLNQLIDSFKEQELDFEPGSSFGYSNSGYTLLTAIIEKVTGMSYTDYIQEQICHPLGMYNTDCDDGIKVVPGLASGYSYWEEPIHPAYADMSFPLGAYGLYSTTEDLFIWDKALRSSEILSKELTQKMFTPNLGTYACGWMIAEIVDRNCVHHFGDISGFSSEFLRFVDDQVTIIFLSNMNVTPVTHLSQEIAKIIFGENVSLPFPAVPIPFAKIKSIEGKYLIGNEEYKVLDISVKNEELYLTAPKMYGAMYKFKLVPVSHDSVKTTFVTEMINEQLVFYYSPSGAIEYVQYIDCYGKRCRTNKAG